jgi:hypothetical protein
MQMLGTASISALLLVAAACGGSSADPERPVEGASGEKPAPLPDLERMSVRGRLEGLTIEYWVGGGLPPPHHRSDQLLLLDAEGRDTIQLSRPFLDPASKREGLTERFRLAAEPAEVRKVAQLILDTGVFDRRLPEEKDPGRADAVSTEVIVKTGGREFKRRYFSASPGSLEPLRAEVERLAQRLAEGGKRELFHQGKPITLPPEPARERAATTELASDAVPLSELAEEASRRVARRLSTKGKLVVWLDVSERATDQVERVAEAVKRALGRRPGVVFSTKSVAGTLPVPSGSPGGHVNILVYKLEPHPDVVLSVGELNGRTYVSERDAGKDPLAPASSWSWILYGR